MNDAIMNCIELIDDLELQGATDIYLRHYWDMFSTVPASIKYHHTYTGGLLDHSLEIVKLGLDFINLYKLHDRVNVSHFVVAALIHDIAKVFRYEYNEHFESWGYTKQAKLDDPHAVIVGRMDHSIYPIMDFPLITGVPLPRDVAIAIMGHMGGFSVSSVKPETLMDTLMSAMDHLSSRLVRHGDPKFIKYEDDI